MLYGLLDNLIDALDPSDADFANEALRFQHETTAKDLIQKYPVLLSMQSRNNNNATPLIATLITNSHRWNIEMLMSLLAEPCDVNAKTGCGRSALHYLALDNHYEFLLRILIHAKNIIAVNATTSAENYTPVYLAALKGSSRALAVLTTLGKADVNISNNNRQSPLHVACLFGQTRGGVINPNLDEALALQYESCIQLLLARGALVNARDAKEKTPADYLASAIFPHEIEHIKIRILKTLQYYGTDLNTKALDGYTSSDVARYHHCPTFAAKLEKGKVPSLMHLCIQALINTDKTDEVEIPYLTERVQAMKMASGKTPK